MGAGVVRNWKCRNPRCRAKARRYKYRNSRERRSLSAEQAAEPQVVNQRADRILDASDIMPPASRAVRRTESLS
jgi:hypothetical protein